jgi:hypothetical protein
MAKKEPLHQLMFQARLPKSLDLEQRATQVIAVQQAVGQICSGLLANQVPMTMAVSFSEGPPDLATGERVIDVTLYWQMHMFRDVLLAKRCLDCADFMAEGHVCIPDDQRQNQDQSGEGAEASEILQ